MSVFFVNVQDGRVATRRQLRGAGLIGPDEEAVRPWHGIQRPSDASTMWYAVMRKREREVFIGTLCFRHGSRLASLQAASWEEVGVPEIGLEPAGRRPPEEVRR